MSKIKVLTPSGKWSEPVYGLDKVHLMMCAISYEYSKTDYWVKKLTDELTPHQILKELEIDGREVTTEFMEDIPIDEEHSNRIEWAFFTKYTGINLSTAKSLKIRLSTLREIASNATYLSDVYNELISVADIPASVGDDHCLMFKFEKEL